MSKAASRIATLDLTPGDMCNLECEHCYAASSKNGGHGDDRLMTEDEIRTVVQNLAECGVKTIDIAGGEPTLAYDRLLTAIEEFKFQVPDGYVGIVTNSTQLDPERVDELKSAGLDAINLSFEGTTREVNDSVRGEGHFRSACAAASMVKEAGLHLGVSITINAVNRSQANQFVPFANRLDADGLAFQVIEPRGRAPEYWDKLGLEITDGLESLLLVFDRHTTMHLDIPGAYRYREFLNTYFNANIPLVDGQCPGGDRSYVVTSGGDLAPCPLHAYVLDEGTYSVADSSSNLDAITAEYLDFNAEIDSRGRELVPCAGCEYNEECTHCPVNDDVVDECVWVNKKERELRQSILKSSLTQKAPYTAVGGKLQFDVPTQTTHLTVHLTESQFQELLSYDTAEEILAADVLPLDDEEAIEFLCMLRSHGVIEIEKFWEPFTVTPPRLD
ncbi:radical SAM protein [Haloferax marisrubri]|uniref:Radical SAM protein n=2 Tax=Haloferax marisrubri TaxID=1544719 RepID=A0A2P4NPU9_9EURY|nr:radical SAM protein [Haloferax marisrubri]